MTSELYPAATRDLSRNPARARARGCSGIQRIRRRRSSPTAPSPTKTKHIIAVAVAHVTQCPYCIRGHTRAALREGASHQELMEAIWVAAEMRAGAAFAHSIIAIAEMGEAGAAAANDHPQHAPATGEHHGHSI